MLFIDDVSQPEPNKWGDQPPLELLRQLVEVGSWYNLAHDRRGETTRFEGLQVSFNNVVVPVRARVCV